MPASSVTSRYAPVVLLGAVLLRPAAAVAQLTDKEVGQVIDAAAKMKVRSVCIAEATPGEFGVCVQGPEQRIASAALTAHQAHRAVHPTGISAEMRAPTWMIFALPHAPALVAGRFVRASADKLQLRREGSLDVPIDPIVSVHTTYAWDNPVGTKLTAQGVTATFDPSKLPPGALDVLVTTEDGSEHRYTITESARYLIR